MENLEPDSSKDHPKRIRQSARDTLLPGQTHNELSSGGILCDECIKLDLPGIVQEIDQQRSHMGKREYRFRHAVATVCPLCQILIASRCIPKERPYGEEKEDQEERYEVTTRNPRYLMGLDQSWKNGIEVKARCLTLIRMDCPKNYMYWFTDDNEFQTNGGPILLKNSTSPTALSPRMIPRKFEPDTAKSWLSYCINHHKLLCGSKPEPLHNLQVIDCTSLSIKNGKPGLAYVALSYVWAKSGGACGPVRNNGGRKQLPEKLSAVVHDSIEVAKALGFRYLWIDKFCIDQNDAALKHDQIQQMGSIYQNSALTIICAAGMDETYGLPGVGRRARAQQPVVKYQDLTVFWHAKDPQTSIASSHWSTRGWTFQEALLSRRRLVFTDDQMYFECRTMNCFESVHCPLDDLHVKNKTKTYEEIRSGMFGRSREHQFGKLNHAKACFNDSLCRYFSNVEDYSSRTLGYDEDSLNAFNGVLGQFSKEKLSFGHIWGVAYPEYHAVDTTFPRGHGPAGKA
ncbi:hypothetical protein PG988_010893 [Apiospora saccharicola]